MKKKLVICSFAALAVLGLASCDNGTATPTASSSSSSTQTPESSSSSSASQAGSESTSQEQGGGLNTSSVSVVDNSDQLNVGGDLNICLNYKGYAGVTLQKVDSYSNLDGKTYQKGGILPTWNKFAEMLTEKKGQTVTIKDSADYTKTSDDDQHSAIFTTATEKFVDASGNKVDLYCNSAKNMSAAGQADALVALDEYLDKMPNLNAFLTANPSVKTQLEGSNGKIYVAPYFDGFNDIEKMFMMDRAMVAKLLDGDSQTYDTAVTITTSYTPFIAKSASEKIAVVGLDSKAMDITVSYSKNIIEIQNALATKDGASLTNALKSYIDEVYGEYIGAGKLYEKRSDIFTSASACYNTDELVALMRCVKTNPQLLTGGDDIHVLFPRTGEKSRINNIMQAAQIFGVNGLTSETGFLYFDKDEVLQDARTTDATYTALRKMNSLYNEGLIEEGFTTENKSNKYAQTYISSGKGFMEYDYSATSVVYNALDEDSIGTASNTYGTDFAGVLPPVTTWDTNDTTHNYTRFSQDTRQLKSGGWCIPKTTDNLDTALAMIDLLFSKEGSKVQDFGPSEFWDGNNTIAAYGCPKINPEVFRRMADIDTNKANCGNPTKSGWNDWYRIFVGATEGIGHVRSNGLDYQVMNARGKDGLENLEAAISAGVLVIPTSTGTGMARAVNTFWTVSEDTIKTANDNTNALVQFWAQAAGNCTTITSGLSDEDYTALKALFETADTQYLQTYRDSLNTEEI